MEREKEVVGNERERGFVSVVSYRVAERWGRIRGGMAWGGRDGWILVAMRGWKQ